jgi:tetratricopeptide (TPR) repeat protein
MTRALLSSLVVTASAVLPAKAQVLPISTTSEEAREHFERGRAAAFHWDSEQTHEHLNAAIAADPGLVLAYLHLAGTSRRAEREPYFDLAEAYRDRASESEQRMIDAFRAFLLEDDVPRAIEIFEDLAARYPDDPTLPGYLGMRDFNVGQYDAAAEHFEQALARSSDFVQAHNLLGHIAFWKGEHSAAEKAFQRYRSLVPDQAQPYLSLGLLYRATERYDEAAAMFEEVFRRNPDFDGRWRRPGWMRNLLGHAYLDAERYGEAERVFRENIGLHSDDPHTYDSLGQLYLRMGRYDEAIAQFEQALERDPDFTASRENLLRARSEAANVRSRRQ